MCLVSQDNFIAQFPVQAPSLRSLFFQKRLVNRTAQQWLNDLAGNAAPFFPDGCYESGFNVGDPSFAQARIGVVSLTGRWEFAQACAMTKEAALTKVNARVFRVTSKKL